MHKDEYNYLTELEKNYFQPRTPWRAWGKYVTWYVLVLFLIALMILAASDIDVWAIIF